jgi:WD40 repeat protein
LNACAQSLSAGHNLASFKEENMIALTLALLAPSGADTHVTVSAGPIIEALHPIALAPAPSGSRIVAAMEDGSIRIIDAKTHQTIRALAKHPQPAYALAWSPDGQFVASGDETARIWIENALTGQKVREYRTHTKGIQKLSYNQFGTLLISTGKDDQVNVYDVTSKKPKEARHMLGKGMNFYGATFNPQSTRYFDVGMLGGGLREYDATTGNVVSFLVDPNGQGIFDVSFSLAGTRAVSAGKDGNAIVWDAKTCRKVGTLRGHQDWVVYTAFSPNGRLAATSSIDHTVKVWNLQSLQKLADIPGQCAVGSPLCFTADGGTLVTVNDMGCLEFNNVSPAQAVAQTAKPVPQKKAKHRRRRR